MWSESIKKKKRVGGWHDLDHRRRKLFDYRGIYLQVVPPIYIFVCLVVGFMLTFPRNDQRHCRILVVVEAL